MSPSRQKKLSQGRPIKIIDRVADGDGDLVFVEWKRKLVVDVRDKDDLQLYYRTIGDYFKYEYNDTSKAATL